MPLPLPIDGDLEADLGALSLPPELVVDEDAASRGKTITTLARLFSLSHGEVEDDTANYEFLSLSFGLRV